MYLLMNKNKLVASFSINYEDFGETYHFQKEGDSPLPIGFHYIESWLQNRKASKHNEHLRSLMRDCGCDSSEGFIKITHAASITDTYWVKNEKENVRWENISYYNNKFNEVISKLAFEGLGLYGIKLSTTSPELSTDGSFRKCWTRENGEIYLYKRGSTGAFNSGLEPYCEVMGAELACHLTTNSVAYSLEKLHKELASKCKAFTNEQFGYVPIARFQINHASPNEMMKFYSKLGSEDTFRRMLVLDALTFNVDRHAGNHGVIVDNETQQVLRMAPVFDMNMSMLPYVTSDEFSNIGDKLKQYAPRIGDDFTRIGQQAVTPEIRSTLVGLKGFQFSFRGDEKFSEWRVKTMEELVNRQLEALLSKEILFTKDVFISQQVQKTHEDYNELKRSQTEVEDCLDGLASRIMKFQYFSCYDVELEDQDGKLIFYLMDDPQVEIHVDPSKLTVEAVKNEIQLTSENLFFDFPKIGAIVDVVHDEMETFINERNCPWEMEKDRYDIRGETAMDER